MSKTYDISNNIIIPEYLFYPSLYKSDYNDISNNNYFILESSKPIDLTLWKNSIIIDSSNNISINHKILSKLIIEFLIQSNIERLYRPPLHNDFMYSTSLKNLF